MGGMSALAPYIDSLPTDLRTRDRRVSPLAGTSDERRRELCGPNVIVRWAFYLSLFCIPFAYVSLPGTGGRLTILRLLQVLILCAVVSQPRVCIRFVPTALFWFFAYCVARIIAGLWLSPELRSQWLPSTLSLLQYALPWVWIMFNVLQFPDMRHKALWALIWGCFLCALLHIVGIGVVSLAGLEGRSSVFGENANTVGATYAVALTVLVGLGMFKDVRLRQRVLLFLMFGAVAIGLAKTGSRSAVLILAMGISVVIFYGRAFGGKSKRLALAAAIGIILAGVVWQIPTVIERFQQVSSSAELRKREGRVRMAPVLWEIFLRSPIYGSGPDDYSVELTRRAMPYLLREHRLISAHNLALMLLAETGIIGFVLFACGVRPSLTGAWRARLSPCGSLPLALLVSLVIAGLTVSQPGHYLVFWFAMAYGLAGRS